MSSIDNLFYYLFVDKMCIFEEYYDIDFEKCILCFECFIEDLVLMKCLYFVDILCKMDFFKGFVLFFNFVF